MPSSVIRIFSYGALRRELLIVVQSGRRYVYQGVPEETYTAMMSPLPRANSSTRRFAAVFASFGSMRSATVERNATLAATRGHAGPLQLFGHLGPQGRS
jgi:hypothetical protein